MKGMSPTEAVDVLVARTERHGATAARVGAAVMASARGVADEQVHVNVVVVVAVAARPEHGVELAAGAGEDFAQEGALACRAAPPAFDDGDLLTTREPEVGDVDGVAVSVLREMAAPAAVAAPAAIGGDLPDPHHLAAELPVGRGLDGIVQPAVE